MELPSRPRFNNELNTGHLLTAATLALAVFGGYAASARENAQLQLRVATLEKNFTVEVERLKAEASNRVALYAPQISALNKSQDLQDERIANVIESQKEARKITADLITLATQIRQDVAVMRVELTNRNVLK